MIWKEEIRSKPSKPLQYSGKHQALSLSKRLHLRSGERKRVFVVVRSAQKSWSHSEAHHWVSCGNLSNGAGLAFFFWSALRMDWEFCGWFAEVHLGVLFIEGSGLGWKCLFVNPRLVWFHAIPCCLVSLVALVAVGTFTPQKQSQREHESASMSVSQTCQKLAKVPVAFAFVGVSCFSKIVYN